MMKDKRKNICQCKEENQKTVNQKIGEQNTETKLNHHDNFKKNEIKIDSAEEFHVEEISQLEKICFPEAPWSYQSIYEDIVNNPKATYVVILLEERVIAYGGVWKILDEGHITNIAVSPEFRRLGFGRILVRELMEKGEKLGINLWTLEVRESNEAAIKLYENFGFTNQGIRPNYYEDNDENAIIMWKL